MFFFYALFFLLFCVSGFGFLNNLTRACHEQAYAGQSYVHRPLFVYAGICLETQIWIFALFGLLVSHILPLFKSFLHKYLYLSSCFLLTCYVRVFLFKMLCTCIHMHIHDAIGAVLLKGE